MRARLRDPVWRTIVFLVSLVEVPLFLLRNRALFRNAILYPFWHWSFGHTISGIDYAARLYWPHRISLLYLPHPSSNPLLPRCFEHSVDTFVLRSRLGFRSVNIDAPRLAVLRFYVLLVSALRPRVHVIEHFDVYRTLGLAEERLLAGDPDADELVEAFDYTGYVRLLHLGIGRDAGLPPDLLAEARVALDAGCPGFLERPFVTLVLRRKGAGLALHTSTRDAGPEENYLPAVRGLADRGYHVVAGGETDPAAFADVPGFWTLREADLSPQVLNLFLFTRCTLFVGQQSGAPVLANAAGVPCLLTDALPHRYGTFRRDDIVLFKRLRERSSGRILPLTELYREHPELAYGYGYEAAGVDIEPSSPDEIAEAVEEALALAEGRLELSEEDERLVEAFRSLLPPSMHLAHHGNRPPLAALRRLRDDLLAEPALAGRRHTS